jgi:hypothetical protein
MSDGTVAVRPDAVVGRPGDGAGHHHLGVVVGVGDGVLEQGVHGRDELAPLAHDGDRGGGLVQDDLDAALVGRGPDPLDGVGHDQVDQHRFARRGLLGLDAERSSRSSMMRLTRKASLWMRPARRWATSASGSATSVSASRPSAPMGVLSSWLTLATKSRRISSSRRRSETSSMSAMTPERAAAVVDLAGPHLQGAPGRPVEVEGALGRPRARRPPAARSPPGRPGRRRGG